jgi:radical SAM superfamily enzyme YgiQ (UPF0313 family)
MTDVLICSVPSGIINRPPAAPALLKACAEQSGFAAQTIDLSLLLYHDYCDSNFEFYNKINRNFEPMVNWEENSIIQLWLDHCVELIANSSPKFLAISVFSTYQHRATVLLTVKVKQLFPNIKIIVGGYGLPEKINLSFRHFKKLNGIESLLTFDQYLQKYQLADFFVTGEGESKFVDILAGSELSNELVDLNTIPPGNFDDYKLDQYLWHNEPVLTITGSKGCVRSCTFCNVPKKFGRYRRKSGNLVAEEIIHLSKTYNIQKFEFTDSLVNGSLKDFEQFITVLADYNCQSDKPIQWYGQYICRPQSQTPARLYALMKQAGACNLTIGAESGSDAVLEAMNKKMTVKDIFDELDQFEQHGLQAQLLVMGSFYNETWDRFLETLSFIAKCHRYIATGVISRIAVGLPLILEPGEFLHSNADKLGIVVDPHNYSNWTVNDDASNTWLERLRRKIIAQSLLHSMNVSTNGNGILELQNMIDQFKHYEKQLRALDSDVNTGLFKSGSH